MNLTKREDSTIIGIPPRPRDVINQIKINYMPEETAKPAAQIFSTRDLYLAATLVYLHFKTEGIDLQISGVKARGIGFFKFIDTEELREARSQYNSGLIQVEPRMYISTLQSLKAEVVNLLENPTSDFNRNSL